jgi:hypothetical protein
MTTTRSHTVYGLFFTDDPDSLFYVGQTCQKLPARLRRHRQGGHFGKRIVEAEKLNGCKIRIEAFRENLSMWEAHAVETRWIKIFRQFVSLWNTYPISVKTEMTEMSERSVLSESEKIERQA